MIPSPDVSGQATMPTVVALIRALQEHADLLDRWRHTLLSRAGSIDWASRAAQAMTERLTELTDDMSARAASLREAADALRAHQVSVADTQDWMQSTIQVFKAPAGMR